jgi:hypothetical protein
MLLIEPHLSPPFRTMLQLPHAICHLPHAATTFTFNIWKSRTRLEVSSPKHIVVLSLRKEQAG